MSKKLMFLQRCDNQIYKQMPKYDKLTSDNVYYVSEYCVDIYNSMIEKESTWAVNPSYMTKQLKISETIRSTLIDWIIQIDYNFKLLPESLFLTVNIIDRFFSKI